MHPPSVSEGTLWPPQYAHGNKNVITIQNLEFNEPHSHIFSGYTNNVEKLSDISKEEAFQFHNPNKVDFEVESKRYFEYVNKDNHSQVQNESSERGHDLKHLLAGGIAGCVASVVTCPLDVIKTRQQSSGHAQGIGSHRNTYLPKVGVQESSSRIISRFRDGKFFDKARRMQMSQVTSITAPYFSDIVKKSGGKPRPNSSILHHYRYIMKVEGPRSLYKGLGPTLVGVIPSRAIYFYAYASAKRFFVKNLNLQKDSTPLHLLSAGSAGLCCTTATSPLWVIKTKLQLHHRNVHTAMNVRQCCEKIWRAQGLKGFYRGITASYAGVLETIIHFVIYERLKLMHQNNQHLDYAQNGKVWSDYIALMMIAAMSKTTATCIAYPHEVVRTRLREETTPNKYRGFFQTLLKVARSEGVKACYRGLGTQIVRQVPNMAIVMGTYEFVIDAASRV